MQTQGAGRLGEVLEMDVVFGAGVVVLLVWVGLGILWMVLAARFRSGR
jgi:hypothetical protein